MDSSFLLIVAAFFAVSAIYSAAGFGGGSSYLAILTFVIDDFYCVRTLALLCNLVVVTGSVWRFYQSNLVSLGKTWPLVGLSIPMAFLGAQLEFSKEVFYAILGATLIAAATAMMIQRKEVDSVAQRRKPWSDAGLGGAIGFLSGTVGIGGGIFLSPLLHLIRWDTAKRIAAVAAFFILINSIAGLAGLIQGSHFDVSDTEYLWLLVAVAIGGQIGVGFCLSQRTASKVRTVTAAIVFAAGVRILFALIR